MNHAELRKSLAEHVASKGPPPWVVVEELTLGEAWVREHPGVADVFARKVSWRNPDAAIYEVKVSRGDLMQDLAQGKWQKYLPHCNRLLFAIPAGMASKDDFPAGVGLMQYNPKSSTWRCMRQAHYRDVQLDPSVYVAALFKTRSIIHPVENRARRLAALSAALKDQGDEISAVLNVIYHKGLAELRRAKEEAKTKSRKADALLAALNDAGLPTTTWALRSAIDRLRVAQEASECSAVKDVPLRLRQIATLLEKP